jgi:hypothetical protein
MLFTTAGTENTEDAQRIKFLCAPSVPSVSAVVNCHVSSAQLVAYTSLAQARWLRFLKISMQTRTMKEMTASKAAVE